MTGENDLRKQDISLCQFIAYTALPNIREAWSQELASLLKIIGQYAKIHRQAYNQLLTNLFVSPQDSALRDTTGSVGMPPESEIEAETQRLVTRGNIREICACFCCFIKKNGCVILWDVLKNPNEYHGLIDLEMFANKEDELERLLGMDLETIFTEDVSANFSSLVSHRTGFPDLCSVVLPVLYNGTRHGLTAQFANTMRGSFPEMIRPMNTAPTGHSEPPGTKDVTRDEIYFPLSPEEAEYQSKINPTFKVSGIPDWGPGRNYFVPNSDSLTYKLRKKYGKLSIAQISGHALLIIQLLGFLPRPSNISPTARNAAILLGLTLWMAPFHHSIHEILMAGRLGKMPAGGEILIAGRKPTKSGMRLISYGFKTDLGQAVKALLTAIGARSPPSPAKSLPPRSRSSQSRATSPPSRARIPDSRASPGWMDASKQRRAIIRAPWVK